MAAQAASTQPVPEVIPNLDVYRDRDDFMRAHNPQNAEQRLLLAHAWRAWRTMAKLFEVQEYFWETTPVAELTHAQFGHYRAILRQITEAERIWHRAIADYRKCQATTKPEAKLPSPSTAVSSVDSRPAPVVQPSGCSALQRRTLTGEIVQPT